VAVSILVTLPTVMAEFHGCTLGLGTLSKMKTFIGIVLVLLGIAMMKSAGASTGIIAGTFFLVFGGCSVMAYRKVSLNHL